MPGIAEVLRDLAPSYTERMMRGSDYVLITCPFHGGGQERTPSCSVSTNKPVFFCFGCKASGHISKLLQQLGLVGSTAQLVIDRAGFQQRQRQDQDQDLYGATPTPAFVDETQALNPYRGNFVLSEDVLDPYRAAPIHLLRSGFKKDVLWHFEVGYDPMNLRITFPLRNIYGELVGISGRTISDAKPRYKIYREELKTRARAEGWKLDPAYSVESVKKALLWHGHLTRPFFATSENDWLVLTEGFKACMWVFQAGYQLVNALVGSYLSRLQANLIARDVGRAILFLDNNEAGWEGTYRAAFLLQQFGVDLRIARYPDEREQPDELADYEVLQAIEDSTKFIEWRRQ